jgi:hypothetical protein
MIPINVNLPQSHTAHERSITRLDFARLATLHCRMRSFEPDQRHLDEWLASVWVMVEEDMRPDMWAAEYIGTCR